MSTKTETLQCEVLADAITFKYMVRDSAGDFQLKDTLTFYCSDVPDTLENGDYNASMKSYGMRAFLMDRSSDFRKDGIPAYMQAMQAVFESTLEKGLYKAKRAGKAGSIDTLLIAAIAELKGIELAQAEVSIKALTKEQRDRLATNDKVKAIIDRLRSDKVNADVIDLDDLI